MYVFHDFAVGGLRGMNKLYLSIKSQYTWPKMRRELEDYVKQSRSCQINKILTPKHKAPMEKTMTAELSFEKCYLDAVGPLPGTLEGNKYYTT